MAAAVVGSIGRFVKKLLNVKDPVGEGGCRTFTRSHRQSPPILMECRPFSQVRESDTCVTLVPNADAVLGGDPSC